MAQPDLQRLRRLGVPEILWRAREASSTALGRVRARVQPPTWQRRHLATALTSDPGLSAARRALATDQWSDAQRALSSALTSGPSRFVIGPELRSGLVVDIHQRFPTAAADAAARANRLLAGRYNLLGYDDVAFDGRSWHTDPVHERSAPRVYWSTVPFLDPVCGDHKVTWEFNRHQHWLELGRAYWLTNDRRYRDEVLRQLASWMAENPPLIGINWASMLELGFRSLSWVWALHFFADEASHDRSPWLVDLLLGLDRQLAHVERHLSYYFSPNTHLLGEALALYVAGRSLPLLRRSARWTAVGRRVLVQEMGRQIAADGGHCERSAHYHRYALDFYLLALAIARVTDDPIAATFERACARLAEAARVLADDRGQLPQLGDDDGGSLMPIARRPPADARDSLAVAAALTGRTDLMVGDPPEEVWWMLGHPRFSDSVARIARAPRPVPHDSSALPLTGYYVSRNTEGDHLVIDAGPHGYLNGGHAHADALAITFTSRHRPLLIDTGTACYTIDAATRDRFRSSVLHNTLTLNGRSQSVPRGPFHWQHSAQARARRWRTSRRFDYFVGAHDGYAPLTHHRHVLMLHGDLLVVADCITAAPDAPVESAAHAAVHWHLHPDWAVEAHGKQVQLATAAQRVTLHVAGGTLETFRAGEHGLGWHAPAYGRIVPTTTLRLASDAPLPLWIASVFALDGRNPVRDVALEPGTVAADGCGHATALTITRAESRDRVLMAETTPDAVPWQMGDIESDAALVFERLVDGQRTTLALVDATVWRDGRQPGDQRRFAARVPTFFEELSATAKRKAS